MQRLLAEGSGSVSEGRERGAKHASHRTELLMSCALLWQAQVRKPGAERQATLSYRPSLRPLDRVRSLLRCFGRGSVPRWCCCTASCRGDLPSRHRYRNRLTDAQSALKGDASRYRGPLRARQPKQEKESVYNNRRYLYGSCISHSFSQALFSFISVQYYE